MRMHLSTMARVARGLTGTKLSLSRRGARSVASKLGTGMKLIAAVLLTGVAFAYGVGVGYCRWPPFSTLQAAAQTTRWRAPDSGKSAYYGARLALFRELNGM